MSEDPKLIKNCVPLSLAQIEKELNILFKNSVGNPPNLNSLPAPLITTTTPNIISANSTTETFNIEGVSLSESIPITIYHNRTYIIVLKRLLLLELLIILAIIITTISIGQYRNQS